MKPVMIAALEADAGAAANVWTYIAYLLISVALTIWVARTLHRNGRIFLVDSFLGNEALADSVNHLLVVGFYLINIGYVTLALKYGEKPTNLQEAIEFLSTKIGLVLMILGVIRAQAIQLGRGAAAHVAAESADHAGARDLHRADPADDGIATVDVAS